MTAKQANIKAGELQDLLRDFHRGDVLTTHQLKELEGGLSFLCSFFLTFAPIFSYYNTDLFEVGRILENRKRKRIKY